jgi:predicted PurR-regulated permease PerM
VGPAERRALRVVTLVLVAGGLATLAPLAAPLVLAGWFADLLRPLARRLERLAGGRRRSAAAILVIVADAA